MRKYKFLLDQIYLNMVDSFAEVRQEEFYLKYFVTTQLGVLATEHTEHTEQRIFFECLYVISKTILRRIEVFLSSGFSFSVVSVCSVARQLQYFEREEMKILFLI